MTKVRLTGNRCQCPACGLLFTSPREFDRHRVGQHAGTKEWRSSRRCLSPAELLLRGWVRNARGFWMKSRPQRTPVSLMPHLRNRPDTGAREGEQ